MANTMDAQEITPSTEDEVIIHSVVVEDANGNVNVDSIWMTAQEAIERVRSAAFENMGAEKVNIESYGSNQG